jgi:hypothetical protein
MTHRTRWRYRIVIRRWTVRLCLLVVLLTLPLGAFSLVRTPAAAETVIPTYGAPSYLDGSPVGGGAGYLNIIDPSQADYVVDTAAELKSALAKATSGQIVYVADGATITITSSNWYGYESSDIGTGCYLKAGVTLAGGRGRAGVTGGIIKVASTLQPTVFSVLIWCADSSCRVTGLTLVGAQEGTTGDNLWCGIWTGDNAEVDNNEIHGFGYGGVRVDRDRTEVWIHHNYIHHNRQSGYGYGVCVNAYNIDHTSSAIVEGNKFDYARHVISGSRGRSSYIFRYNYLGANCTNTQIDVHGQNSGGEYLAKDGSEYIFCAGYDIKIYNNTSICTSNPLVGIRGIPYSTGSISVQNNWTYTTATQEWQLSSDRPKVRTINEQMDNIPGYGYQAPNEGAFVRMTAKDNWYGTTAPPDSPSAVNQPPLTPAAPSGTTSGKTGTSYTYRVKTTDPDGDTIVYTIDWGDGTSYTTGSKSSGTTAYPGHTWTQAGTYAVKVRATDSKGNVSAWSSTLTVQIVAALQPSVISNSAPTTPSVPSGTTSGLTSTEYQYSAMTSDPDADKLLYTFEWGDGMSSTTGQLNSGVTGSASHTWMQQGTYAVKVQATDSKGNVSALSPSLSVTIATPNQPPLTPAAPSGTVGGETGTSYACSVETTDPDGDSIAYTIDWGDGTSSTTELLDSGVTASVSHAWTQPGAYTLQVKATDSKGAVSALSSALSVNVINQPQAAPATSAPSTPAAAPAQGTSAAVTPTVETPTDSSTVGPSTATVENAGGSLSPAVGGSSAGGPQRSGFAWWLFSVSVIVGGAVLLTGAIVRDATSEPPGW